MRDAGRPSGFAGRARLTAVALAGILLGVLLGLGAPRAVELLRAQTSSQGRATGPVLGYHALGTAVTRLAAGVGDAAPLPDSLVIDPGVYAFGGATFDLTAQGLVRLLAPGLGNAQRIVYAGDVQAFVSAVAWIVSHGNAAPGRNAGDVTADALVGKVIGTCGSLSTWLVSLAAESGVRARMVSTLTLDQWNGYDNGHTLVEILRPDLGRWVLYDIDNNAMFTRAGDPLDLLGFVDAVATDDYAIVRIAADAGTDVDDFRAASGYRYEFYTEYVAANEQTLRAWYRRVIQVPLIELDGEWRFFDAANRARVESYSTSHRFMDETTFRATFYSGT